MKKVFAFVLIAALALMAVPIGAVSLAPGVSVICSAVQAEMLPGLVFELPTVDIAIAAASSSARRGSARRGSAPEGGDPPVGDNADGSPPDATPAISAKNSPNYVAPGKRRRFECIHPCYWDQTRYRDADELGKGTGDIVEFNGPTEIPKDFQFDNWQEI